MAPNRGNSNYVSVTRELKREWTFPKQMYVELQNGYSVVYRDFAPIILTNSFQKLECIYKCRSDRNKQIYYFHSFTQSSRIHRRKNHSHYCRLLFTGGFFFIVNLSSRPVSCIAHPNTKQGQNHYSCYIFHS